MEKQEILVSEWVGAGALGKLESTVLGCTSPWEVCVVTPPLSRPLFSSLHKEGVRLEDFLSSRSQRPRVPCARQGRLLEPLGGGEATSHFLATGTRSAVQDASSPHSLPWEQRLLEKPGASPWRSQTGILSPSLPGSDTCMSSRRSDICKT